MKKTGDDIELRREAERMLEQANEAAQGLAGMSHQCTATLVHELRVHQIELRMQNDELRRIQAELENTRDRYVHLYDFAPTAYFTVNEKGAIAEANLTAATLLTRPRADLVGRMFSRFIHRDDQDVWYHHRKHLLETGDFQSFQLRLVKHDGGLFYVHLECMQAAGSNDEPKAIRIAATDVTSLKQAEQALQQANTTLEQRVAERTTQVGQRNGQLQKLALEMSNAEDRERRRIAQILHDDLQQGLASLRFMLWNIFPREKIDAQVEKNISDLEKGIAESIQISRSLSTELSPPVLQQHGLKAALAWLAKDMQSGHGLSVTFLDTGQHIEPESVALASVLFRMVKELLFNVVKHAGLTSAHMDARINGNMIVISVQDHGKGFDAADLQVRQDVFGLFSIKERINVLGGTFTIDSSPGAGCRVTLTAPREELSHIESISAPSSDQPVLNTVSGSPIAAVGEQGVRIIIADDHSTMREGLAHLLKGKDGLEVIALAGDGRQVIGLAKELNPDLILMDVSMPELDGIQATAHISRVQPDICIIGLSMHEDKTTRERMLSAGAAAHLCKSIRANELLESIRRIVTQWAGNKSR